MQPIYFVDRLNRIEDGIIKSCVSTELRFHRTGTFPGVIYTSSAGIDTSIYSNDLPYFVPKYTYK